ncbi:hypothetical protein [Desulfuribacillus alkaliarsenatis]|uniref:Uncharacterized protein n=1 Tax=Desulfuribacillus alkaliarsenatis TaxID=766136 RepID=A0A1E5G534_9FIRM|nr:hypothetical protein [Desulfuribacillus alkaliarsenatis]OEF97803.1 hypothetical protein BHF68_13270 [Desulfuribacillus alkaliarsenatis]
MQLFWYMFLFFVVWLASHIAYWNIRNSTFIPGWMIYTSVGISTVIVLYYIKEPGQIILFTAFVLGVVQANQEVASGER